MQVDLDEMNEDLIEAQERQKEMDEYQSIMDEEWYEWVNNQNCTD